jgi:prepilin-type N-terminal cleavage/methylation domain-containing protein
MHDPTPTHADGGFTLVEVLVTVTVLGLIFAVLTDTFVLGLRTTSDTQTNLAQTDTEQFAALWLTKDVRGSTAVATDAAACGVSNAPLVLQRASSAIGLADSTVVYARTGNDLSRVTCPIGATGASTTNVLSDGVAAFTAACTPPGACGTVHVDVQTTAGANTSSYQFGLDIGRREP